MILEVTGGEEADLRETEGHGSKMLLGILAFASLGRTQPYDEVLNLVPFNSKLQFI